FVWKQNYILVDEYFFFCCTWIVNSADKNYSEGAVIKAEGILLQCQRDDKTLSTNPLVWRRVKP
ncbi:DUF1496 domain-containing protein, partial [Escherichia coli]|uniref:DUF1496 domain-containing protein n=1 Tax=Escherichia coli TaxID=562 RepID=UPI001CED170F